MKIPRILGALLVALCLVTLGKADASAPTYTFKRGVNISHWLSQTENQAYALPWFGENDVAWIAEQGFDHIRLPVDVRLVLKPNGSLDESRMQPIADAIAWSKARGLGVVLDAHFLPGGDFNSVGGDNRVYTDMAVQDQAASAWRQLAKRFASEGPYLRFEILNEPVAKENTDLNPFMHRMLHVIRESNPTRIVYVTSNKWSSFHTINDVVLPDDANIALTIHFYEPIVFTHQRAPWVGFKDDLPPVVFPGIIPTIEGHTLPHYHQHIVSGERITKERIDATFADVAAWVSEHAPGIEVYVGEFGVFRTADPASAKRWISVVSTNASSRGWGWAVWDYNDSFGVRGKDGKGTAILKGLFP